MDVSGASIRRNLKRIRDAAGPGVRLIPMVKADAYGVGVAGAVRSMDPVDPWAYGVATVDEGLALRDMGVVRPVVIFSPVGPGDESRAVLGDLQASVSDVDALGRLAEAARAERRPGRFHLEVDTGMGRAGLRWDRVSEWGPRVAELVQAGGLVWVGVFTHFHSADESPLEPTRLQWERLIETTEALKALGAGEDLMVHACNSPGSLRGEVQGEPWAAAAVRPGIHLYGGLAGAGLPAPEPVAAVRARVLLVKDVPAGATVGYGATHTAAAPERWATLGIGYGDGLPRSLSNRGHALIHGERASIVGRISMDVTVVDITGRDDVRVGDVATLIGEDGQGAISLEEVADLAGTINYEVLTGLTPRLPRVWSDDGDL